MRALFTQPMKILPALCTALLAGAACVACGRAPSTQATPTASAAPAVPEEEVAAAKAVLGGDAEVLVFGPLGGPGTQQVVAVNRLAGSSSAPPAGAPVTGTTVSRVSILSKENGAWLEVLRGDEYLKNSQGYLRGTPPMSVAGWRLEIEQQTEQGRVLHFTPLAPPAAVKIGTVSVAWNPKTKRYQSLDRVNGQFRGEISALETPNSKLQ